MLERRDVSHNVDKQVDQFTLGEKSRRLAIDSLFVSFGGNAFNLGLVLAGRITLEQSSPLSFALYSEALGIAALTIFSSVKLAKKKKENIQENPDLGVSTEYFFYNGEKPLKSNNLIVHNGDGIAAVSMPELIGGSLGDNQSLSLKEDYYDAAVKAARDQIKDKPYKFVIINKPSVKSESISTFEPQRAAVVTANKGVILEDPEKEVFLLTRKEFEDLSITPQEGFAKIQQNLKSSKVDTALRLLQNATTSEQKLLAKDGLKKVLRKTIQRELDIRTTPQMVINKDALSLTSNEEHQVPYRKKAFPSTKLIEGVQGGMFVQTIMPGVGIKKVSLDQILKTRELSIGEVIESDSEYKIAQLAYTMYQMIDEVEDINDLIRPRITDPKVLKDEISKQGILLNSQDIIKVDGGASFKKELKRVHRRGRAVLTAALLWASMQAGTALMKNPEVVSDTLYGTHDMTSETLHQPSFPDHLPKRYLDWEITEKGLDSSGYFITETASDYKDGKWVITTDRAQEVHFDTKAPGGQPQLTLKRIQSTKNTKFKLPIKNGTRVAALSITDNRNISIPYKAFTLTDGTVEINLTNNRLVLPPNIMIQETLVKSEDLYITPHAVSSDIHIDESKLNPNAQFLVKNIKDIEQDENSGTNTTAYVIAQGRKYSLAPTNHQFITPKLTASPTDYINIFSFLDGASCDIAGSAEVILANTLKGPNEPDVNLAIGYLNGTGSPAAPNHSSFLRSDLSHAFAIDENGKIIDATHTHPADDPLTQAYAKQLEGSPESNLTDEAIWKRQQEKIVERGNLQEQLILLTELLGGSATSFFALRQSARLMKRLLQKESIADIPDRAILKLFSDPKELEKAYNFYSWISYGTQKEPLLDTSVTLPGENKSGEIIDKFQQNINIERLGMYTEHPGKYEKLAKLTPAERIKMRVFANYLLT